MLSLRILTVTMRSQNDPFNSQGSELPKVNLLGSPRAEIAQVPRLPSLHPSLQWKLSGCGKFCINCKAGL